MKFTGERTASWPPQWDPYRAQNPKNRQFQLGNVPKTKALGMECFPSIQPTLNFSIVRTWIIEFDTGFDAGPATRFKIHGFAVHGPVQVVAIDTLLSGMVNILNDPSIGSPHHTGGPTITAIGRMPPRIGLASAQSR